MIQNEFLNDWEQDKNISKYVKSTLRIIASGQHKGAQTWLRWRLSNFIILRRLINVFVMVRQHFNVKSRLFYHVNKAWVSCLPRVCLHWLNCEFFFYFYTSSFFSREDTG
jgi:hypothetical protein